MAGASWLQGTVVTMFAPLQAGGLPIGLPPNRVYDNSRARQDLDWAPRYDFAYVLAQLQRDRDPRSPLARVVGSKGYHAEKSSDGPYPVE